MSIFHFWPKWKHWSHLKITQAQKKFNLRSESLMTLVPAESEYCIRISIFGLLKPNSDLTFGLNWSNTYRYQDFTFRFELFFSLFVTHKKCPNTKMKETLLSIYILTHIIRISDQNFMLVGQFWKNQLFSDFNSYLWE